MPLAHALAVAFDTRRDTRKEAAALKALTPT